MNHDARTLSCRCPAHRPFPVTYSQRVPPSRMALQVRGRVEGTRGCKPHSKCAAARQDLTET
eukprot:2509232-Prymnesium_polylepis.1